MLQSEGKEALRAYLQLSDERSLVRKTNVHMDIWSSLPKYLLSLIFYSGVRASVFVSTYPPFMINVIVCSLVCFCAATTLATIPMYFSRATPISSSITHLDCV